MSQIGLNSLLALGSPASPAGTQQDPRAQLMSTIGMFLIMGVMFYFVLFRPQQKKAKEHAQLLKAMKPGDKVVTSSGIVGTIISVKERTVSVRSGDAKFEVTKASIAEITERGGEAGAS